MISYKDVDIDFSLKEKTAIITGGAAGIGFSVAEFFTKKEVNCVLADLNPEVTAIADRLGQNSVGICGDVLDSTYRNEVLQKSIKRFGAVDILVNSAGIAVLEKAESISDDDWCRTIDVNLTATFKMVQTVGSYMIGNKSEGCIVNMASQAGVVALDKHVAYCASKGGVISMTKVLAYEWGKYGIRVNCVSPTVVLTELGHKAWDGSVGDEFKKQIPAGRFAEPDEIAAAIAFLCSDGSRMITGHNLLIDGGYTIQ
jgi:NAD(P)-dependent dehydrogenase (short-subunit alcohol dehydrogenase family)